MQRAATRFSFQTSANLAQREVIWRTAHAPRPMRLAPQSANAYFKAIDDLTGQRTAMTNFSDRERAFEAKFANDQELQFKIIARRNRLLGEWAAERMGLTPEERDAYAKAVVQADFEEVGDEDVIRKVTGDLTSAQIEISDSEIRAALEEKTVEARRQFMDIV